MKNTMRKLVACTCYAIGMAAAITVDEVIKHNKSENIPNLIFDLGRATATVLVSAPFVVVANHLAMQNDEKEEEEFESNVHGVQSEDGGVRSEKF